MRASERIWLGFLAPKFFFFILFIILPILLSGFIAFSHITPGHMSFVGLANWQYVLNDHNFWRSVGITTLYAVVTTPLSILLALFLASQLMTLPPFWRNFFRAAFYLPSVTAVVIMALVWQWLFNHGHGFIDDLFSTFGLHRVGWLINPHIALWSIMLMAVLTPPGMGIVLYMSQMGSIPEEYYEAARLDGAGAIRQFTQITAPLVTPTTLYLAVLHTIAAFQIFTVIYIMTGGGPGYATTTVVAEIYDMGFQSFHLGRAGAEALILAALLTIFSYIQFKVLGRHVEY